MIKAIILAAHFPAAEAVRWDLQLPKSEVAVITGRMNMHRLRGLRDVPVHFSPTWSEVSPEVSLEVLDHLKVMHCDELIDHHR